MGNKFELNTNTELDNKKLEEIFNRTCKNDVLKKKKSAILINEIFAIYKVNMNLDLIEKQIKSSFPSLIRFNFDKFKELLIKLKISYDKENRIVLDQSLMVNFSFIFKNFSL